MNNEPQALPCTSVLMILISFQGRTDQSYEVFVTFPLLFGILKAILPSDSKFFSLKNPISRYVCGVFVPSHQ